MRMQLSIIALALHFDKLSIQYEMIQNEEFRTIRTIIISDKNTFLVIYATMFKYFYHQSHFLIRQIEKFACIPRICIVI